MARRRRSATPDDPATRYARQVSDGTIPSGLLHRAAADRHLRDLETARDRGWAWSWDRAEWAIKFFGWLRHFKGEWAGRPVVLDPWQQFGIGSIYGWFRESDGRRRFRTVYWEVPRGNGKSTKAAGVALIEAFALGEPGAEVYCVATTRPQARIVFGACAAMVRRSTELRPHLSVKKDNIHSPITLSKIEPVSSDAGTLDGLRAQAAVIDELHAHPSSAVVDVMVSSMGTRRQPLMFEITTAGVGRQSICRQHRDYSEMVVTGRHVDDEWFAFVCGADPDDAFDDPAVWRKANPGFGVQVKPEQLEAEARKASRMVAFQNPFRRYYLNQWVEQEDRAIDMRQWDAGARPITLRDLAGRECFLGFDLSMSTDLTAASFVFPDPDGGLTVWPLAWIPSDAMWLRSQRDRVPYDAWARDGWLSVTPGAAIDYDLVAAELLTVAQVADLRVLEVGFDRYNSQQFVTGLERQTRWTFVDVPQSLRAQSEPTKRVLSLLADGKFRHPGNPVFSWSAGNVALDRDGMGNLRFSKKLSRERIDPMIATVNGAHRWIAGDASPAPRFGGIAVVEG